MVWTISTQPGPFTNTCGWFCMVGTPVAVTPGHRIRVTFTQVGGGNEQWLKEVNAASAETGPGTKGPDSGGANPVIFQHTLSGGAAYIQLRSGVNAFTVTNVVYDDLDMDPPPPPISAAEGSGTVGIVGSVIGIPRSLYLYENRAVEPLAVLARSLYLYENQSAWATSPLTRSLYLYENRAIWAQVPLARCLYLYEAIRDGEVFPWLMKISPTEQVRGGQVDLYGDGFGSVVEVGAGAVITASSTNGTNVPAQAVDRTNATEWVSNDDAPTAWIRLTFPSPQLITMIALTDRAGTSAWGVPLFRFDAGADVAGGGPVGPPTATLAEYPAGAERTLYTLPTPRTSSFLEIRVSSGGVGATRGLAEVWVWADQDVAAEDSKAFLRTDEMGVVAWVNRSPGLWPANSGLPIQPAATATVPATGESGLVRVVEST